MYSFDVEQNEYDHSGMISEEEQRRIYEDKKCMQEEDFKGSLELLIDSFVNDRKDLLKSLSLNPTKKIYDELFSDLLKISNVALTKHFGIRRV